MEKSGDTSKADALMKEADKKIKGSFFKNLTSSKSERIDEGIELVKQAANIYKLAKAWDEAAKAYLRCAELQKEMKEDPSDYYVEAANMQKKYNSAEAVKTLDLAVRALCDDGKISQAARLKKQIGEMYEADKEYLLAAKNYQDAFDFFETEGELTTTNYNLWLKVPELKIMAEENKSHIVEGIKIYEKVGKKYLEHKLTSGSAKDMWFRIGMLHLANDDTVGAENSIDKYAGEDPAWGNSREAKLIAALSKCMEEKNLQGFSDECAGFNDVTPFDRWKTIVLNRAKANLEKQIKGQFDMT